MAKVSREEVETAVDDLDHYINGKLRDQGQDEYEWDYSVKMRVRAILRKAFGIDKRSGTFLDRI